MGFLGKFARSTCGNVGITMALSAIPLFGAAGIAMDFFRKGQVEARLQAAVDSAALAGATSGQVSKEKIRKLIRHYAMANGVDEYIAKDWSVKVSWKQDGTLRVAVESDIKTTVAGVLGFNKLNVAAASEVTPTKGAAEIALVLDTTDSMNSGGRIGALRDAAEQFIDVIKVANTNGQERIKVSLVPYAHYVNVGAAAAGSPWLANVNPPSGATWRGCVGPREHPLNTKDGAYGNQIPPIYSGSKTGGSYNVGNVFSVGDCAPEIEPLTADSSKLISRIRGLTATGWTYIPGGLMWGWRTLSSDAPYSEGASPSTAQNDKIQKVVVLMTDGLNTMEKKPGTPYLEHNLFQTSKSDQLMMEVCEQVKKDNILLFTIGFKLWSNSMKSKLEQCASTPENYYDASDDGQLTAAYEAIAKKISTIHLSK